MIQIKHTVTTPQTLATDQLPDHLLKALYFPVRRLKLRLSYKALSSHRNSRYGF